MESDLEQEITMEAIYEKIDVLSLEEYHLKDEVDYDVFFTRSFYDYKKHIIVPVLSEWKRACMCESIINPDSLYVTCDQCNKLYHTQCVNFIETDSKWICPRCCS